MHFRLNRSMGYLAAMEILYSRRAHMSDAKHARFKQMLESGEACLHPLTLPQRELWEASPWPVSDVSNHICALVNVRGPLTERDSQFAVDRVVERQEVMRLSILPGKEQPVQLIRAQA